MYLLQFLLPYIVSVHCDVLEASRSANFGGARASHPLGSACGPHARFELCRKKDLETAASR